MLTSQSAFSRRSVVISLIQSGIQFFGRPYSLGLLLATFVTYIHAAPLEVRHPEPQIPIDAFYKQVLELALEKAGGDYRLVEWKGQYEKNRALAELKRGKHLDVAWAVTTIERERSLRPVRISLDRGLAGVRLALIKRDRLEDFKPIKNASQLAGLHAGQGFDWPDTVVLKENGLPVRTGRSDLLPKMLAAERFDYYPRSVRQIWDEVRLYGSLDLIVEPGLVLYYPSAVYFFVQNDNLPLALALERGLYIALADGSFDRLFLASLGPMVDQANLPARRVIILKNSSLPPSTTVTKPFWLDAPLGSKQQ